MVLSLSHAQEGIGVTPATASSALLRNLPTGWLESGQGNAPILLFLHGFPDGPGVWDRQANYFSDRFHVVRPYGRGLPQSPGDAGAQRFRLDAIALDWLELLQRLDPDQSRPIFCVGHDLGAAVACELAPLLGKRLHGLVLINGLGVTQLAQRYSDLRQQLKSWYLYAMQVPGLAEAATRLLPRSLLAFAYQQGKLPPEDRPSDWQNPDHLRQTFRLYRSFARDVPQLIKHRSPRISVPLLVIWGDSDAFLEPPTLDEFSTFASNVTIRILSGNHWLFRQQAEEINNLLDSFIDASA